MKLADIVSGPDWLIWIVFIIFMLLAIVLFSGHGSWLIAGYNTASEKEKSKFDQKKLGKTVGIGMAVIAILSLLVAFFQDRLPASFAYVMLGTILLDCFVILIIANTFCRK